MLDNNDAEQIIKNKDYKKLVSLSDDEKEDLILALIYDHLSDKPLDEMNEAQKTLFLASKLEDTCQADSLPSLSEDEEIFSALPEMKAALEKLGAPQTAKLLGEFISLLPKGEIPECGWFFEGERGEKINTLDSAIADYPDGHMKYLYAQFLSDENNAKQVLEGLI